ncbi:hypothetical protein BP6252_00616 [Coleophoma cylindrospora]|uniref:Uncharacterized protein n=1 Tax=Coleophoma cylindrospora TaxID=1849047 RepID=A0A3D8SQU9_9HELO|nr:hypothetical protein BP6252_00616 [Coleophoma cylindrospora]
MAPNRGPPPPPPAPNIRPIDPRGPHPPGQHHGPAPPPPPPPPPPIIHHSIIFSDVTPRQPMTADDCRKKLTTYAAYLIRKHATSNANSGTWAKAEFMQEAVAEEEIVKLIKQLNEKGPSAAEKMGKLFPFQQTQVTKVLDHLRNFNKDPNFEWSLAQLNREERRLKDPKKKETTAILVYLKRAPIKDLDPIALHRAIERHFKPINEELFNGPRPPPELPPPPVPLRIHSKHRPGRGRSSHSDSSSDGPSSDSDDSRTTFSTEPSTVSSGSHPRRRRSHVRSHSRHRTYRQHFLPNRASRNHSPEERIVHVEVAPEPPRQWPATTLDPASVAAAAYQAGKMDADAERLGVSYRHRHSPPAERAVVHQGFSDPYDDDYVPPRAPYGRRPARDYVRVHDPIPDELMRRQQQDQEDRLRRYVEVNDYERRPRIVRYDFEPYHEPRSPFQPLHPEYPIRGPRYSSSSDSYSYL